MEILFTFKTTLIFIRWKKLSELSDSLCNAMPWHSNVTTRWPVVISDGLTGLWHAHNESFAVGSFFYYIISKYALEVLHLIFQINTLLSPRSSHRLMWNRFVKNKQRSGGNIPLDLQPEFYNKLVKEAIKRLDPNASKKSLDRICHSFTLGKNACKIANMRYAYPAVIQVKISNIGCLDEVVGFILSKWRTTAINAIKNKTQHFGKWYKVWRN